ncbi:FecR family protein [Spirosoma sp. SC4-14]|uniref:FecR family protein n=1 Tax=Spirosoma sp. SC4-14 TaxID=3128900 RepID=UPI0030D60F73
MNYKTYNAEDFLFDESFRQWTSGSSPQAAVFWEQWLLENPDRADIVRQAQELVRALNEHYGNEVTEERINSEIDRLMQRAAERRDTESEATVIRLPQPPLLQRKLWRWVAAASVVVSVGLAIWLYGFFMNQRHRQTTYADLTKASGVRLQEKVNNTAQIMNVVLNDGSVVTLQPKSRLSYPSQFEARSRTVYLNGEAFFDVVKNPAKPFLIYANQTVTQVLGTSFLVRAYDNEQNVVVTVRTGRVSVYKQQDFEKAQQLGSQKILGVILMPNQQMTLNLDNNRLQKQSVEQPRALQPEMVKQEQVYEDAPVAKVFENIERAYGVKLLYTKEDLSACLVNITFSNESLLERLEVICQTIGATYEVQDGQIVINSKGCQ